MLRKLLTQRTHDELVELNKMTDKAKGLKLFASVSVKDGVSKYSLVFVGEKEVVEHLWATDFYDAKDMITAYLVGYDARV